MLNVIIIVLCVCTSLYHPMLPTNLKENPQKQHHSNLEHDPRKLTIITVSQTSVRTVGYESYNVQNNKKDDDQTKPVQLACMVHFFWMLRKNPWPHGRHFPCLLRQSQKSTRGRPQRSLKLAALEKSKQTKVVQLHSSMFVLHVLRSCLRTSWYMMRPFLSVAIIITCTYTSTWSIKHLRRHDDQASAACARSYSCCSSRALAHDHDHAQITRFFKYKL